MYNETVVRFFRHLWPLYCKDAVDVELLPFWHYGRHASPFYAAVVWDADKWAILADENDEPRTLFARLFHELGHVAAGEISKNVHGGRGLLKRAATGCLVWTDEKREVSADVKASKATAPARRQEVAADRWAEVEASRWWPVLESLGDGATDRAMSWAIDVHKAIRPIQKGER